eukprot:TRINITY_DN60911_c0_g1_i1.p1 TRINITY_DN60911_c0_g1~~TRINITY_DN60911_c0_g1_i1.p1  ORF type:complete len:692 (+),score=163.53 TRINITY_DN60911_c0_g1_i1:82-2076(+)
MVDSGDKVEPGSTLLPDEFNNAVHTKGTSFIAIKVSPGFDWASQLDGSQIFASEGQVSLEPPEGSAPLSVRVLENRWQQIFCLAPEEQGSNKLTVKCAPKTVLQVLANSPALGKADNAAQETDAALSSLKRKREKAEAAKRSADAKQRAETRKKCRTASLREALAGVGWTMTTELEPILNEDVWDGVGTTPKQRVSKVSPKVSDEALAELESFGTLKVKAIQAKKRETVPVAFWSIGHLDAAGLKHLRFRRYRFKTRSADRQHQIWGRAEDAPNLKVIGKRAKIVKPKNAEDVASDPFGELTLIGAVLPNTKKLYLFEGEVFNVDADRSETKLDPDFPEPLQEEDAAIPATSKEYRDKRMAAIDSFGTAKKLRGFGLMQERLDRKVEVVEIDKYNQGIQDRIKEQTDSKQTDEDKDWQIKLKILPSFVDADKPSGIYKAGLEEIASEDAMEGEPSLIDEDLVKLLKKSSSKVLAMDPSEAMNICRSHIAFEVLRARANQGQPTDEEAAKNAKKLCRKLGVLNMLLQLRKKGPKLKRGKCQAKHLTEVLGVEPDSPILLQLHKYCYDEVPGERSMRIFNERKTLCALIIWALSMSPEMYVDVKSDVEQELGMTRQMVKTAFGYVGCRLDDKKEDGGFLRAVLKEAPKFNAKVYEMQARPKKKGKR